MKPPGELAGLALLLATALPLSAQHVEPSCDEGSTPGMVVRLPLPAGHEAELRRSGAGLDAVEERCSIAVTDASGSLVWMRSGFRAAIHDWTGRDVDGDDRPDAVLAVDAGGGNRCCWEYTLAGFTPEWIVLDTLAFHPFFEPAVEGPPAIWRVVPFYGLGRSMADAPILLRVVRWHDNAFRDVTLEQCDRVLEGGEEGPISLADERSSTSPERLAAARAMSRDVGNATDPAAVYEVETTRMAATTLALQLLACERPDDARSMIEAAWPGQEEAGRWAEVLKAYDEWQDRPERSSAAPSS